MRDAAMTASQEFHDQVADRRTVVGEIRAKVPDPTRYVTDPLSGRKLDLRNRGEVQDALDHMYESMRAAEERAWRTDELNPHGRQK